jgi:tRNA A-37 threonylcarbamoyl transferase component Bud32
MSDISESKRCPKCGRAIPDKAPQGLCPKCLLLQATIPTERGTGQAEQPVPPTREELAAAFPQLEILELIGQGGMGFVFKARQPKLERLVALKILSKPLASEPAFAERFTREGRVLARLNHPNIVTIHDFGQEKGFFYLLMEFVDGVNLRQAMKVGRFTPSQALAIVPKICEALEFAHNEGILHRDIKPENILLDTKGRVKIADFGIAKLMAGGDAAAGQAGTAGPAIPANLTEIGKALGTPDYMAPEQREHPEEVDQRADIYSLGVVFYEMLTGELPLGRFAAPSEKSGADPRVDKVVLRTLEKERERRYQKVGDVKTDVETVARQKHTGGTPVPLAGEGKTEVEAIPGTGPTTAAAPSVLPGSPPAVPFAPPATLPWALIVVAAFFILGGCLVAWNIAHGIPRHNYNFDPTVLTITIPIGVGLLRRRRWWRFAALALLWLILAWVIEVYVFIGLLITGHLPNASVKFMNREVTGPAQIWVGLLMVAPILALLGWMLRVLVRPAVKVLFQRGPFVRPWIEWGALAGVLVVCLSLEPLLLNTGLDRLNSTLTASSFGPTFERVVYVDRPESAFLDLTTGNYVASPKEVDGANWMDNALTAWLAAGADADVMATLRDGDTALGICNTSSRPVSARTWNKPWLLDEVETQLLTNPPAETPGVGPVAVLWRETGPATFAFHTLRHGAGLLQIVGYTENPRGVKIRYKLCKLAQGVVESSAPSNTGR